MSCLVGNCRGVSDSIMCPLLLDFRVEGFDRGKLLSQLISPYLVLKSVVTELAMNRLEVSHFALLDERVFFGDLCGDLYGPHE